jgi:hypothetical protein
MLHCGFATQVRVVCTGALLLVASLVLGQTGDVAIPLPGGMSGGPGNGSPSFRLTGYLEDTFSAEHLRAEDRDATVNNTRFRVNLEADVGLGLDFGATVVSFVNSGDRSVSLIGYLPEEDRGSIVPYMRPAFIYSFKANDTYLQEGFVSYRRNGLMLRAGRQKFYSGTGYAYNPIDLFNRKDPLDPTYEVDGLDAALLEAQLSGGGSLKAVIRRDDDHDSNDYQLRYEAHRSGWDYALQATHHSRWRVDYEALGSGLPLDSYEREFIWKMAAVEAAGEIGVVGVHGEAGYAFIDAPDEVGSLTMAGKDHLRLLIGADYTFESQLSVMAEYLHLGQGRTGPEQLTVNDRFAYLAGETLAANRDTLFAGVSYPITDLMDLSLYSIVDLNTPSALLNPWLTWSAMPALTISASATVPVGDKNGPNGEAGLAGFVRARYNF